MLVLPTYIASEHMRNGHFVIVNDVGEVIRGESIGLHQDEVVQVILPRIGVRLDIPKDQIHGHSR
jgi:hypothetical protein